jgi:HlyD family secretion protein
MEKSGISKKVLHNRHVLISRIKARWSFLAWLFAALLAVAVYFHGGQFGGMTGSVFTRMEAAAPALTGRLDQLLVDVGDVVKKGDLMAQMDTTELVAEKAVAEAKMHSLIAEIKTEEVQNLRRFDASIIRLESEHRDLHIKQIEAQSELTALKPEFERLSKLVKLNLIDEKELMPVRTKIQSLETILKEYPTTLAEIARSITEAKRQKETISVQSKSAAELVRQEAEGEIQLLQLQIDGCSLRAYEDGVVSRIYYYPGNMVPAGENVLACVVSNESRVIGFLSEYNARDVTVGMKAYLTPVSGYGAVVESKVLAITPEIYTLPSRVSPLMGQAYRGRRVVLQADANNELLPGESVEIHFSRPWTTRIFWNLFGKSKKEIK